MGLSITGTLLPGSLDSAFAQLTATRPLVAHMRLEKLARVIAERTATQIDQRWLTKQACPTPFKNVCQSISAERVEIRKGTRYPEVDTEMELVLFPVENKTLLLINTDTPSWRGLFTSLSGAQPFDYWDGECPEDISPEEWDYRAHTWKSLLSPDWVPANHGLVFKYSDTGPLPDTQAVLNSLPTLEARALAQAKDRHMVAYTEKHGIENFTRGYFRMQDEPQLSKINADAQTLKPILPPITTTLLETGF